MPAHSGFRFPARLHPPRWAAAGSDASLGYFVLRADLRQRRPHAGPFLLPADIDEGDWIEIGQLGAYGACLRTAFNGFDRARLVEVRDGAMAQPGALRLAA